MKNKSKINSTEIKVKRNFNEKTTFESISALSNASSYKCKCIDFYLGHYSCSIIANEFRYGKAQLVTDLLLLTSKNLISIEIKAENDDLRRLRKQIDEAKKNFNLVIVFAAEKHLSSLLNILSPDVGISILSENKVLIVRSPQRHDIDENEILYSMPLSYLRKNFKVPYELNSDLAREFILAKAKAKINTVYRKYIISKYQNKFKIFLSDRGTETHIEDIPILSIRENIEKL